MTGFMSGITTLLALVTFLGICWWAFSKGRRKANREASMLPFSVPDEPVTEKKEEELP
jgi:cytochrome c oxidase cbb3-type subunit 4